MSCRFFASSTVAVFAPRFCSVQPGQWVDRRSFVLLIFFFIWSKHDKVLRFLFLLRKRVVGFLPRVRSPSLFPAFDALSRGRESIVGLFDSSARFADPHPASVAFSPTSEPSLDYCSQTFCCSASTDADPSSRLCLALSASQ